MLPGNLQNIFADAGVEWKWYRYFEPKTVGLDFEGMMEDLRGAPEGSVVILHGTDTSPALSASTPLLQATLPFCAVRPGFSPPSCADPPEVNIGLWHGASTPSSDPLSPPPHCDAQSFLTQGVHPSGPATTGCTCMCLTSVTLYRPLLMTRLSVS